jgi:transposase
MPNENNILNFLNLKEEDVEECSIHNDGKIVYFDVTLKRKGCECPNCFNITKSVKDYSIKLINHTIFNDGRYSKIRYKQRRYYCSICKKSFVENNPFTKPKDKISKLIISNVIEKLKDPCRTYESIATELNISTTEVIKIFDENIN